jgi:succinate dehydrogenase / fumarate reductase iron-sulfur subunit
MAAISPRRPERPTAVIAATDFNLSEFAADKAGSLAPFGEDVEFPLPVEQIWYQHPKPQNRPRLAEGR